MRRKAPASSGLLYVQVNIDSDSNRQNDGVLLSLSSREQPRAFRAVLLQSSFFRWRHSAFSSNV